MADKVKVNNDVSNQPFEKDLHSLLGWMKNTHAESAQNADASQAFLELGVKNNLAQALEKILINPIEPLYKLKQNVDNSCLTMVQIIVSTYLKNADIPIFKAFLVSEKRESLTYCICLKEDTLDNRIAVNNFFEFFDEFELSSSCSVFFHFIEENHIPKIKYLKQVV